MVIEHTYTSMQQPHTHWTAFVFAQKWDRDRVVCAWSKCMCLGFICMGLEMPEELLSSFLWEKKKELRYWFRHWLPWQQLKLWNFKAFGLALLICISANWWETYLLLTGGPSLRHSSNMTAHLTYSFTWNSQATSMWSLFLSAVVYIELTLCCSSRGLPLADISYVIVTWISLGIERKIWALGYYEKGATTTVYMWCFVYRVYLWFGIMGELSFYCRCSLGDLQKKAPYWKKGHIFHVYVLFT